MTHTVEMLRADLAEVITTPSLLRRILFREQSTVRFAVRVLVFSGGTRWVWDAGGKHVGGHVGGHVERLIVEAARRARRPQPFNAIELDN